jgi:hypothetical protein
MILLILEATLLQITNSTSINPKKGIFFSNNTPSVVYINSSSPYDYGWKSGIIHRVEYRFLDLIFELIKNGKRYDVYIENHIFNIKQFYPSYYKELEGLSDSTGINIERLIATRILLYPLFGGNCTVTAATGPATKDNNTFITENFDSNLEESRIFKYNFMKFFLIPIIRSFTWRWNRFVNIARFGPDQYKYAFIGLPVISETTLLNEKGLGYGGTGTHLTKNGSRTIDEGPGILPYLLNRIAMRTCKNVSEVVALFKNSERSANKNKIWPHDYDYDTSIWCDKNGDIAVIEQSHSYIEIIYGNSTDITGAPEGILWHTNHHIWIDANKTGSIYREEEGVKKSSFIRADRAKELLVSNYGNITLEICKSITRDHKKGSKENKKDSWDICRHPDKNDFSITLFSWIIEPKKTTVYLTYGSPCNRKYIEKDLSTIF